MCHFLINTKGTAPNDRASAKAIVMRSYVAHATTTSGGGVVVVWRWCGGGVTAILADLPKSSQVETTLSLSLSYLSISLFLAIRRPRSTRCSL